METQIIPRARFVAGVYNWDGNTTKEIRKLGNYQRHNFCDIDILEDSRLEAVLQVFEKYQVDCISHRVGRGWHVFGDIVPYEIWKVIWSEIKPQADPKWSPLTLRISKKFSEEIWERPIYHKNKNDPPDWARALMYYLMKALRDENPYNLWTSMKRCGLEKHFGCTVYPVEKVK